MNWSRGLFRPWVLITAMYLVPVMALAFLGWPQFGYEAPLPRMAGLPSFVADPVPVTLWDHVNAMDDQHRHAIWQHVLICSLLAVVPPALVLAFSWAGIWVARGFRST
jgi:hypothetical protein